MKNDLIERYIYAVTKKMPKKIKDDVKLELETLIDDMLEERCKDIEPTEKDIMVVLYELGTPSELIEKYNPDSSRFLIGGAYFQMYKFVLTIVLISVTGGLFIANLVNALSGNISILDMTLGYIGNLLSALLSAFGFITLLFAILEKKGVNINPTNNTIENLPPVPKRNESIKISEPIFAMIISMIFAIYILSVPGFIYLSMDGVQFGYLFNAEYIRGMWYVIVIITLLGIINESFKLYERRYTKKLSFVTLVCNTLALIFVVFLFTRENVLNIEFIDKIIKLLQDAPEVVRTILENINLFVLAIIIFGIVIETLVTTIKGFVYDK